jgi:thioesterase domain-containing protein
LVGFEMTRQLREQGREVGLLALMDAAAIVYRNFLPVATFWGYRLQALARKTVLHLHNLVRLSFRQKWKYIISSSAFACGPPPKPRLEN